EPVTEVAPAAASLPPVEQAPPVAPTEETADQAKAQPRILRRIEKPGEQPPEPQEAPPQAEPEKTESAEAPHKADQEKVETPPDEPPQARPDATAIPSAIRQPIRIAAPSIRATPPRPPKSHRHPPGERHAQKKEEKSRPAAVTIEIPKVITLTGSLTVKDLAERMMVSETEIIKRLFMKGIMRTVNQLVELEVAREVAIEMGYEVASEELTVSEPLQPIKPALSAEEEAQLVTRPPVVTIMGHVDHGKTSLLDAIRKTKFLLTDAEAGGITQHIGAYHVEVPGEDGTLRQIVFLDTPGHEAFTAMRARGAKATDIAVLVVAADDGVMPQTAEAIDHAKAAGVPIIVAVNKIDLPGADPDRVLTQLMEHGLVPDKFGGETVTVNVSAKKHIGLDELLEMILLVADIQDLKANPDRPASGIIIEAELSRGKGAVATALVQTGTLREGDFIVAGSASGRVRALFDDRGQRVKAAGPSMPVEVLGLDEVPLAGDRFDVVEDVQAAKSIVEQRKLVERERRTHRVTLESLHDMLEQGEVQDLNVIIKADVQGTAEAIADSVRRLSAKQVQVRVLRVASGDISENDVNLAAGSNAIIIGFNAQPDQNAARVAQDTGVDIRTYDIIYQITDDLEKAIQGLIQPVKQEVQTGSAEIRQIFKVGKNLTIGGCYVTSGKIQRGCIVRVERGGEIIHEGKLETLKRFKDDVKEVAQGFECGMGFGSFHDIREGDIVHAFVIQEIRREPTR
ncbi:MAG TPA: translation initiation factor IF-2, partial [Candidatus Obscuribacterales bacterium]